MKEGDLFANRYLIRRMLGRGAFSEVYLALDQKTQKDVALKIYAPATGLDDQDLQMFAHEFSIVMDINHQNLLKPTYFDDYDRHPYLVLPYCRNGNVKSLIGKISEPEAWRMLHDVASGLAWLHNMNPPIVHQDIKPDNVMRGNQGEYLITDFGVSTSLRSTLRRSAAVATDDYRSAGTTAYMAPERFGRKNKPIMANDIYSLGATMFEMLTGDVPFGDLGGIVYHQGAELPELDCNCSEQLKQVVERCLSKEPWDRPVASQLEEWAQTGLRGGKIDFGPKAQVPDDSKPSAPPDKATPAGRPTQPHPRHETTPPKSDKPSKEGSNEAGRVAIAVLCIAIVIAMACIGAFHMGEASDNVVSPSVEENTEVSVIETTESLDIDSPDDTVTKEEAPALTGAGETKINGHEYVDLGLPSGVMWATCNVGADSPSDYGDYFAWGEPTTKSSYDASNSETYGSSSPSVDIGGNPNFDVARADWGSTWRLPTAEECQELIDNCTWKWISQGGKNGYKVTSKKNGKSIFLPAAGNRYGSSLNYAGEVGDYWTSSPHDPFNAYSLCFGKSSHGVYFGVTGDYRLDGRCVRPVSGPDKKTSTSPSTGKTTTVPASDTLNGHEYVDLGLPSGVKWATCNVGADSPSDYGDYFAWGETTTKYSYDTSNSKTDNKSSYNRDIGSDASTDAARANWGDPWRLPTAAECQELIDNCMWTWTSQGGHSGYKVTSKKNGASIFLPAAGSRLGSSHYDAGENGNYWTSSPYEDRADLAGSLSFYSSDLFVFCLYRSNGYPIRPVSGPNKKTSTSPSTGKTTTNPAGSTHNGHDYVDLGLSVKWATCNVGANSPSDYGNYYAWGETKTKSSYTTDNSKTYGKSSYDYDLGGDPNLDAARANWGGTWRLPTAVEMQELIDNCTWTWTTQGGHTGYKVTSKKNGNSIFLPAAGGYTGGESPDEGCCYYWTSTPSGEPYHLNRTYGLFLCENLQVGVYGDFTRDFGFSIRPVSDPNKEASTSPTASSSTGKTATTPVSGTLKGHEYVDLGLSVKWATCNVGADNPSDYGKYFAWGETGTKSSYDVGNSKTSGNSSHNHDIGGDPNLDAAQANWGSTWRLPTAAEMQELIDNCTLTWTSQGGMNGYKVTSNKNGNYIFLPAAGYCSGSTLFGAGEGGCYWTSSPHESHSTSAWALSITNSSVVGWSSRYYGFSVRPVSE